jgi:hypothetical protein
MVAPCEFLAAVYRLDSSFIPDCEAGENPLDFAPREIVPIEVQEHLPTYGGRFPNRGMRSADSRPSQGLRCAEHPTGHRETFSGIEPQQHRAVFVVNEL